MFVSDEIKIISVDKFRSSGKGVNEHYDMVRVTAYMPIMLWRNIHKYFNVDFYGDKLKPPMTKHDLEIQAQQLLWEQKNRKEKEK